MTAAEKTDEAGMGIVATDETGTINDDVTVSQKLMHQKMMTEMMNYAL